LNRTDTIIAYIHNRLKQLQHLPCVMCCYRY